METLALTDYKDSNEREDFRFRLFLAGMTESQVVLKKSSLNIMRQEPQLGNFIDLLISEHMMFIEGLC
jgi:hypothetical protein